MINNKNKIAIFIAGPPRFVNYVTESVSRKFIGLDYYFFYHLWKCDSGNKVRADSFFDIERIISNDRTKLVLVESSYSQESYKNSIGIKTNSNSPIHATMGMFLSQSLLCNCLAQLPDYKEFKYILRLRTDCTIIGDKFIKKLNFHPDVLTVSKNHCLPASWISDHIIFGSVDAYFGLWKFKSIEEIYRWYRRGKRNPERTLRERFNCIRHKISLNPAIERYVDYHIVYNPPKQTEPTWVKRAITNQGVKGFFESVDSLVDYEESFRFNGEIKRRFAPLPFHTKVLGKLQKLLIPPKK